MTQIKKRIVTACVLIAATILLMAGGVFFVRTFQAADASQNTQSEPVPENLYSLKSSGETVGVYDQDGALIYVLDVVVSTLPQADQESLAAGIPVKDEKALKQIIEDLTS